MPTSKKVFISTVSFLLLLIFLSGAIIIPWKNSESGYYMDSRLRESLAGKIDFIVLGASHGLAAFSPTVIDRKLECFSYNLSGSMMPMGSRIYLLRKELERNPVKDVVLEISFNALTRTQEGEYGDGDSVTLVRLDSFPERAEYMFKYVSLDDYLNIFCRDLLSAFSYWKSILKNNVGHVDYNAKGYRGKTTTDVTLSNEQIISSYNISIAIDDFQEEDIKFFRKMIELCKDFGCNVYIVSTPVSDSRIWKSEDWDVFRSKVDSICADYDIKFYDFNLYKEKSLTITDKESFFDSVHMSDKGAIAFSTCFCDVIKKVKNGEDVAEQFYSCYDEMKQHSPYMEYYKANVK